MNLKDLKDAQQIKSRVAFIEPLSSRLSEMNLKDLKDAQQIK
jgi:hypothetical protein